MMSAAVPTREEVIGFICGDLAEMLGEKEVRAPDDLGEASALIASGSLIGSLGWPAADR